MSGGSFGAGRYRIERELAQGGMADVYLAYDGALERRVAVKLLADRFAADPALRERFAREARMAAGLHHPNLVTIFDTGEEDGRPFIVMEFVEGTTLAERLRAEGPLPPREVVDIGVQACAGLAHAHAAGLVHRDVKPGNLLMRADGTVKIADFGIARAAELTSVTEAGTILGTATYLAPEQARGDVSTPRTDVYGLGAVLYEALIGRPPFEFESLEELVAKQQRGGLQAPGAPPRLGAVLARALAADPSDRQQSAEELAGDLSAALPVSSEAPTRVVGSEPTAVTRAMRGARRAAPPRSRVPIAAGLVGVLAVAGVVAAVALTRDASPAEENPVVARVPDGTSPSEDARNLAAWLREHAEERESAR